MKRPTPIWAGMVEGLMDEVRKGNQNGPAADLRSDALLAGPWTVRQATPKAGQQGTTPSLKRDIHDTVLQDLLCLAMGMYGLDRPHLDEATRKEVENLRELATQTYEQLRGLLSHEYVEATEPPRSMRDVLQSCVRSFNKKSGAEVELQINSADKSLSVSGEVARQTDFIIHEALCNAWRHGGGSTIRAVLAETADIIWVRVMDEGPGFDTSITRAGHFGLRIMRERAEAVGARLGISSAPGKGTCVNLYLPSHHQVAHTTQEVTYGYSIARR